MLISTDYRELVRKGLAELPPFSPVLSKLLATLAMEDVSFAKLAALIERDTVMSGNVMKLVNSAAYARRGPISSIAHGISVLGLTKLRNLILGLSITRTMRSSKAAAGWSQANFNMHSVATAVLADQVAQHVSVNYPEGAFIAGLFHDLGRLLIAVAFSDEYPTIHQRFLEGGKTLSECEREVIGIAHAEITALALTEWNLPAPIRSAAEFHHDPFANPQREAEKSEATFHLSEIILASDEVVNRLGNSILPRPESDRPEDPFKPLNGFLQLETREKVANDYTREYEAIRAFF